MIIGPIILQIVLIALNAVFASAEIAVISMNERRLDQLTEDGNKRASRLATLTEQPARFLATIQVAITLAGFLGSAFAADSFSGLIVDALINAGVQIPRDVLANISVVVVTIILSYFSLIFGELVPKRVAMKKAESLSLSLANMLYVVSKVFSPVVSFLTASTNFVLRLFGVDPEESEEQVSEEEIKLLLEAGAKQGNIPSDENEIITNVFEFNDINAGDICTHRIEIVALDADEDIDIWDDTISKTRHRYYPLYRESIDNIIGILDTRDYFRMKNRTKEDVLSSAVEVWLVPESTKANVIMKNMKTNRRYFAVVIDEYGGLSGIVTLHDLLEAIVGDVYEDDKKINRISDSVWHIHGSADLKDVARKLDIDLPDDDFDTFSGFIYSIIDRVPNDGEHFRCSYKNLDIDVKNIEHHRIGNTIVHIKSETAE